MEAAPRDWKRPGSLSKYDMRFISLLAAEHSGEELTKTLKMRDLAFAPLPRPTIERVIQMEVRTVWQGVIYNLFFYVVDGRPRWIIACVSTCKLSVALRVVEDRK